jgi:hypothetical protein
MNRYRDCEDCQSKGTRRVSNERSRVVCSWEESLNHQASDSEITTWCTTISDDGKPFCDSWDIGSAVRQLYHSEDIKGNQHLKRKLVPAGLSHTNSKLQAQIQKS